MAKKIKANGKISLKTVVPFLLAALIVGAIIIISSKSMAGTDKGGRVVSWKQQRVLNAYAISYRSPGPEYQFVKSYPGYLPGKNRYFGAYTEKTTPPYASRELRKGSKGEDVKAFKSFYVMGENKINTDGKRYTDLYPYRKELKVSEVITEADCKVLEKHWGLKDCRISVKDQITRISTATKPAGLPAGEGIVYDWRKGVVKHNGALLDPRSIDKNVWSFHRSEYRESAENYFNIGLYTQKTSPDFGKRTLKLGDKGEDVKVLQSMLNYAKNRMNIKAMPVLKVDGVFGENTRRAVVEFDKYANIPSDSKFDTKTEALLYHAIAGSFFAGTGK